jgi:hypothetical protein
MAKASRKAGSTSNIFLISIDDSSSTVGAKLTGLLFNTSGLTAYYKRDTASGSVAITLATIPTLGTFATGGFKEVDSTNMPGIYELHIPDAAFASGAKSVVVYLKGAANMLCPPIEIELTAVDNQDAVRFGMTALPNAVAGANNGLPLGDAAARVTVAPNGLDAVTMAEPASVPDFSTGTIRTAIAWLLALGRNKITQTSTTQTLRNNADSGNLATAAHSDDGTTYTRGRWS